MDVTDPADPYFPVVMATRETVLEDSGLLAHDSKMDEQTHATVGAQCSIDFLVCSPGTGSVHAKAMAEGSASFGLLGAVARAEVAGSGWRIQPPQLNGEPANDDFLQQIATAMIEVSFIDTLVLNSPGLEGQPGTATFAMTFDGSYARTSAQISTPLGPATVTSSGASASLALLVNGVNSFYVVDTTSPEGSVFALVTVTAPIVIGTPFQVEARLVLETVADWDGNPYTLQLVEGSGTSSYDETARWGGISEVRDAAGNPVRDWTVSSESLTDYRDAFAVPTPSLGAMLLTGALIVSQGLRRR
jgi:hypothetical protein